MRKRILSIFCFWSWTTTVAFRMPSSVIRKETNRLLSPRRHLSPSINHIPIETTKSTALSALRSLSLDNTIMPGLKMAGVEQLILLVALSVLLVRNVFPVLMGSVRSFAFAEGSAEQSQNDMTRSSKSPSNMVFHDLITSLRTILINISKFSENWIFNLQSKSSELFSGFSNRLSTLLRFQPEIVQLDDWKVCSLKSREMLSGGRYCRYRFDLEKGGAKIPLYIGQELILCSTDSKDRVLKESFFPISTSSATGYFEILVKRTGTGSSSNSYAKFVRLLDSLEDGDELAFKGGSYRLNYAGDDDPIKYVTLISTELGIAPAIQMLQGILTDKESTVEDVELLWANMDKKDFVCETSVAQLEAKYKEKLFVSKVLENDMFGRELDFSRMDEVLGALSAYEQNRIAVVCGPEGMIEKFRSFLSSVGYPSESILSIVVSG